MGRKYYLIDTENVGDRWFKLPAKARKKDRIVTFYTENHSKRFEKYLAKQVHNHKILWLQCVPGTNALDYQLMGTLSYLISKHPKASFCIFSNDKGFQSTVVFWQNRGIDICQKEVEEKKKKKEKKTKETKEKKKKNQSIVKATEFARKTAEYLSKEKLTEEQYVIEIAKSVPMSNLSGWHQALTVILGRDTGRDWYQKIKGDAKLRKSLSQYCLKEQQFRGVYLTAIVLHLRGLNAARAEEAYNIIKSQNKKNLQELKIEFDKKFGKNPPQTYYQTLKPLFGVMKGI
ncbi:MAG: hypothetical protein HFI74_10420 [Lachnospiraceae bacterium]|nr:hypothetical protein [Lachnospiraceae bacterium]